MAYFALGISVAIALCVFIALRSTGRKRSDSLSFPPGPPTLPVLGNLHQIPSKKPFVQFAEWGRKYGAHGVLGLQLGTTAKLVILNNWKSVRDLLDQRGATYSSRPFIPITGYVLPLPFDLHLVFMPYGPKWRKARKTTMEFLKDEQVDKLLPIQDAESSQMMHEILETPERWNDHVLRYFGAVIMDSVFGSRGVDYSDQSMVKRFFTIQDEWAAILDQGASPPVDVFPFLKHVPDFLTPWRGWKQRAATLKARQSQLYHDLFEEARERVGQGKGQGSFFASLLHNNGKAGYTDLELEYIGGFLMEGGSDTTAGAFETFILAMATHPDILRKAQAEVDGVFGTEGVKTEKINIEDLPFLRACFLETIRWRPGFPLGVPHATTQDDVYQGLHIPANTTVIMNVWAIHHDPDEYDEPETYRPDRFLEHPLGIKPNARSTDGTKDPFRRQSYGFGAGRRVCAGQRMAENSSMMTMAKLVWSFDVEAEGELDTSVQNAFKDALLTGPKEFPVKFKVRDEQRRRVIEQNWTEADKFLARFE